MLATITVNLEEVRRGDICPPPSLEPLNLRVSLERQAPVLQASPQALLLVFKIVPHFRVLPFRLSVVLFG